LAFLAALAKIFADTSTGWKNLYEAIAKRRENRLKRSQEKAAREVEGLPSETAEEAEEQRNLAAQQSNEVLAELFGFINPIIESVTGEVGRPGSADDQARLAKHLREESWTYIDYHEYEAFGAGMRLKGRRIRVDFE
jgi:hypothetical protein